MWIMPQSYRNFVKSMQNQQRLSLKSLITDLIQEETLMESLNSSIASTICWKKEFRRNQRKFFLSKDGEGKKIFPSKGDEGYSKVGFNKSKVKCFFCKKLGHHIKDCKVRIVEKSANSRE